MSVDCSVASQARVIQTAGTITLGNLMSVGAWIYPITQGDSNSGCAFAFGNPSRCYTGWGAAASNKVEFRSDRVTTPGVWEFTTGFAAMSRWRWIGYTYDYSSTANNPTCYIKDQGVWSVLTNGAGLTRTSTPSGGAVAEGPFRVGAKTNTGTPQWGGYLAHLFAYNRILTESEMRLVADRGARRLPRGLIISWAGVRFVPTLVMKDELSAAASDGTGSGTGIATAAEHPPARW